MEGSVLPYFWLHREEAAQVKHHQEEEGEEGEVPPSLEEAEEEVEEASCRVRCLSKV